MSTSHQRFTVLAVAAAIALAALTVWSVRLVLEVASLRTEVEQRVGWLRTISEARRAMDEGEAAWAEQSPVLDSVAAGMIENGSGEAEIAHAMRRSLAGASANSRERQELRAHMDRMVAELRGQTARISVELGDKWDSINLLVVLSLFFATSTLGLLVYARSVSLPRSKHAVAKLEARLQTSDRLAAVGTRAAGVAHEINNPLTYVTTNLQLLREEMRCPQAAASGELGPLIDDAIRGATRVGGIVRQLETFARVPQDIAETADAADALEAAVRSHRDLDAGIRVQREFDAVPRARGDQAFLQEVFGNIIDNAVRAMRMHHGPKVLGLTLEMDDEGMIRAAVSDTGPGIPDTILAHVFEPFSTTRRLGEGTGLGLFVSHGVVKALGGRLEVETSTEGTTVTVSLPVADTRERRSQG
ncbi:MAG: ATP-binding protein [Myxococcota bacterium]